jgi:hypothetical protein
MLAVCVTNLVVRATPRLAWHKFLGVGGPFSDPYRRGYKDNVNLIKVAE